MFSLALRTIRAKRARFLLSATAVALGVAFMAGTLVLTDSIRQAYDGITATAHEGTDALVRSTQVVEDPDTGEVRGTVDASVLDTVRAVPVVASAEPHIEGIAQVVGTDGRLLDDDANRAVPVALAWQHDPAFNPMDLVAGDEPAAADEIVIDRATATTGGFAVSDTVRVITMAGSDPYTVAGIATYAGADDAGGAPVVAFTPETASNVLGEPGRYDAVQVAAAEGVSEDELAAALNATLTGSDVEAITGTTAVEEAEAASATGLGFMTTFLLAFAIVSLLVGAFVISNTFSITVAQRSREHALLRAIGASRRQVERAVAFEALLTGVAASAIGVVAGIAAAVGLRALLESFGLDLPAGDTVVATRTVVVSMAVGTVVTVVAAYLPARRAARIAPVAAMRDEALDRSGRSLVRAVAGTVVSLAGVALIGIGLSGAGAAAVGGGAITVFVGVAVLGPVVARPMSRLLGAPLPTLRGMTGTIARENATRNPKRSSATASALMVGIGMVVFMTVFGASARASIAQSVDDAMLGDWIVDTTWGQGGLDPSVAATIDALPETEAVTPGRYAPATIEGSTVELSAFDPATAAELVEYDLVDGAVETLGVDDIAVHSSVAEANGWTVGDDVEVMFPETGPQTLTVGAVYDTGEPLGDYSVALSVFEANVVEQVDTFLVVSTAAGVSDDEARAAIDATLVDYPTATLLSEAEFTQSMADEINQLLNMVYALLALAVVIALFGIANTLALSVHERTRELGLLRAVGMGRGQVRAAVRWESAIIALLGTALGTGIGLGFGWALVRALDDQGFDQLALPADQLTAIVAFGALAGIAAAVLPARRAARVDVLAALQAS
jgi:putative ABC transport system permease protein